jgi:glycosyltransferase involved in cell wall biosynthesis
MHYSEGTSVPIWSCLAPARRARRSGVGFLSTGAQGRPRHRPGRFPSAIIAVNSEIARFFLRLGVREDRLHVICPYAVPAGGEGGSVGEALDLPERLRVFLDAHAPRLVAVVGLEPAYDLERQIDLLGPLRQRYPRAGLVIAGSGSLESALRAYIQAKPYASDVLLYGDMPHPITLAAMAQASVCLRLTLYDGDSIAVREALHLGTPVIATDNGMRPPGVVLVPKQDPTAWLEALARVLARQPDPEQRGERRGAIGEENLEAVLRVYERLISEQGASRCSVRGDLSRKQTEFH